MRIVEAKEGLKPKSSILKKRKQWLYLIKHNPGSGIEAENLEVLGRMGISRHGIKADFNKVMGRVQLLKRLHPNAAKKHPAKLAEKKKQALIHDDQFAND